MQRTWRRGLNTTAGLWAGPSAIFPRSLARCGGPLLLRRLLGGAWRPALALPQGAACARPRAPLLSVGIPACAMRAKRGSSTAATAALAEQAAGTAAPAEPGSIFPLPGAPPLRAAPRRGPRRGRAPASAAVVEAVVEAVVADVKGEAEPAEAAGPLPAAAPAAKKRGRASAAVKEAAAAAGADVLVKPEAEAVAADVKGVAEPAEAAKLLPAAAPAAKKRGRAPAAVKKEAAVAVGADVLVKPEADAPPSPAPAPPKRAPRAKRGAKAGAPADAAGAAYEAALAAVAAGEAIAEVVAAAPAAKRRRGKAAKAGAEAAGAAADPEYAADEEAEGEAAVKKPRKRYYPKKRELVKAEGEGGEGGAGAEAGEGEEKKKPRRKKREQTGPVYGARPPLCASAADAAVGACVRTFTGHHVTTNALTHCPDAATAAPCMCLLSTLPQGAARPIWVPAPSLCPAARRDPGPGGAGARAGRARRRAAGAQPGLCLPQHGPARAAAADLHQPRLHQEDLGREGPALGQRPGAGEYARAGGAGAVELGARHPLLQARRRPLVSPPTARAPRAPAARAAARHGRKRACMQASGSLTLPPGQAWHKHDCRAWRMVGQLAGRVYKVSAAALPLP